MPEVTEEQFNLLLSEIINNAIPLTLNRSKEEEEKAEKECDEYIKNGNKNINDMDPLTIYFIISKLSEDKQIKFIKENINYIKENDENIFLYTMLSPHSLSYFFSLKVLKEIKKIDIDLFKKIIDQNHENLFHGFKNEDYIEFYKENFKEIIEIRNIEFIHGMHCACRCCYDNVQDRNVTNTFQLQRIYNKKFIDLILDKYKTKISTFTPSELLSFIKYIEDIDVYKNFINKYYKKLNIAFENISEYDLKEYLGETHQSEQEILIYTFFENIIKKHDITKIIYKIKPSIIIELYNKNKELFNEMTLKDWLKVCSKTRTFNDNFKIILDTFEIDNIESLFDTNFYLSTWSREDVTALKYIEEKYRSNIKVNGIVEPIDENTSIFSKEYLKSLKELKELLKNSIISKNDKLYKQHLTNFIMFLKNQNIINNIEGNNFKEIEKLFYKITMGNSIATVYELSSIEEITLLNRLGQIDFKVQDFTIEQLENYNVKQHKQLYRKLQTSACYIRDYKKLILKLIFMVGFNHAKEILEIDNTLPVLEHLVGNVDVKHIKLDDQGNPILNDKIINLLFNDKYIRIKQMLANKDNDLYKFFPRIFNEWQLIQMNGKDKSLKVIIDYLKSDEISLPPEYHRLTGLFKFIGCANSIVNETLLLHDQILKRTQSTIPKIKDIIGEYSYEVLDLQDMESLAVGNKTDCCFTVLGNGYSCLKHACTSKNGRILVIRENEQLIAHSWIWRNGDLLCLDNIEVSKSLSEVYFFDIYLKFADQMINKSFECEGIKNCIKNITIGYTNFDRAINGIENYPCLISNTCDLEIKDFGKRLGMNRKFIDKLPQHIENLEYSDSRNVQYLIKGNGMFNLGQSNYLYQDEDVKSKNKVFELSKEAI